MCRAERVLLMIAGGVFDCLVCIVRFDEQVTCIEYG